MGAAYLRARPLPGLSACVRLTHGWVPPACGRSSHEHCDARVWDEFCDARVRDGNGHRRPRCEFAAMPGSVRITEPVPYAGIIEPRPEIEEVDTDEHYRPKSPVGIIDIALKQEA
ncbi:hypothetical protein C4D60_Mb05t18400 [Musa balbisiana]|uniref:Uncharacterized protein n=1 Tax=Musa balbisiana TaxID=52838 RepID=A0A4S8JX35_MUSBA|nr:hypothetical protein C4D60_Mb05t18400 [Musa balbisiana]